MTFTTVNLTPLVGTEIKPDPGALLKQLGMPIFRNLEFDAVQQVSFAGTLGAVLPQGDNYIMKITLDKEALA